MDGLLRLVSEERKTNPAVHRYFHYAQGRTQTQVRGMYVRLSVYCLKCEAVCTEVNKVFVMVPSQKVMCFRMTTALKNAPLKSECLVVTSWTNLRLQTYILLNYLFY